MTSSPEFGVVQGASLLLDDVNGDGLDDAREGGVQRGRHLPERRRRGLDRPPPHQQLAPAPRHYRSHAPRRHQRLGDARHPVGRRQQLQIHRPSGRRAPVGADPHGEWPREDDRHYLLDVDGDDALRAERGAAVAVGGAHAGARRRDHDPLGQPPARGPRRDLVRHPVHLSRPGLRRPPARVPRFREREHEDPGRREQPDVERRLLVPPRAVHPGGREHEQLHHRRDVGGQSTGGAQGLPHALGKPR